MRPFFSRLCLALALVMVACGPSAPPSPKLVSLFPSSVSASDSALVTLTMDATLPFQVDYGKSAISVDRTLTLDIGTTRLAPLDAPETGPLTFLVPSGLNPATYDVTLRLGDGRSATLLGGLTVTPGKWPTGFTFDTIPDQQKGRLFGVTLRALGPSATSFHGTVFVGADHGTVVTPSRAGPFSDGVSIFAVTIRGASGNTLHLIVADVHGDTGVSNDFNVQ